MFILLVILGVLRSFFPNDSLPPPEGLLCELLRYPEKAVITDSIPEFGWIFPAEGIKQHACRILVASSLSLLKEGSADLWDSYKIITEKSINIDYRGKALQPHQSYWWKVKVWSEKGKESNYSNPQQFFTSEFINKSDEWPGKSDYVQLPDESWVSEDRQTSVFQRIQPVQIIKPAQNSWFADFGKASFGTLEITIKSAKAGEVVEVILGERRKENFRVDRNIGTTNIGFTKINIPLNEGLHKYKIKITPHHSNSPNTQKLAPFYPEVVPFRYAELTGNSNLIEIEEILQQALYYPFDDNASFFECSDKNLNSVWELCKYTLKATPFLGIYADGNRERMPYEADSYIQQLGHYSVDREFSIARYTTNFLIYNASWPTEWNIHVILMAWSDYLYSGNMEFLRNMYPELKKKTLLSLAREDGLISTTTGKVTPEFLKSIHYSGDGFKDIVDWPPGTPKDEERTGYKSFTVEGERDGYVFTDINTVVNSFHYRALEIMTRIAELLDIKADRLMFEEKSQRVRNSILEKLFNEESGLFIDGEGTDHSSLHANMFPLAFNLVPEEHVKTIVEYIKTRGMACSVYGAQYLLEALFNAGESEYALALMNSEGKRSWINMIRAGSTMTTEAWDEYYKPNLTWNHAWGSAPANIIPRRLMGIEPVEPGFKKFRICPQPGLLSDIKLKLPSVRGSILCDLSVKKGEWRMKISIPGNSEAEVWLPGEFNKIILNSESVFPSRTEYFAGQNRKIILLKSGTHFLQAVSIQ